MSDKNPETSTRQWYGLEEYVFDQDDIVFSLGEGIRGVYSIALKLKKNQFFKAITTNNKKKFDSNYFQERLQALRNLGLDIGKGDAEYGYKMPLPKEKQGKGNFYRELIIFKRK